VQLYSNIRTTMLRIIFKFKAAYIEYAKNNKILFYLKYFISTNNRIKNISNIVAD
jgi:hypothetical protein